MESGVPRDMAEFMKRFATEDACREYLTSVRWPDGFVCPACHAKGGWHTGEGTFFCSQCRRQTSATAGTIFHKARIPLRKWFLAMWLVCTQKTGLSAMGLQREAGLGSYQTAWMVLQKLRQATVRLGRDRLTGEIEVDKTYLGGEHEGMRGRTLIGKALVAIAVELNGKKVGRIRLRHVPDASGASLVGFIEDCVEKGSPVHTDDWSRYNGVRAAGYRHRVTPVSGDEERALKYFPHVHLVASLPQTMDRSHTSRFRAEEASSRLPRRICLPIQPSPLRTCRQTVPPPYGTSRPSTGSHIQADNVSVAIKLEQDGEPVEGGLFRKAAESACHDMFGAATVESEGKFVRRSSWSASSARNLHVWLRSIV